MDVLVAMNAAALKVNLTALKKGGKIIANIDGFDAKNLRLANYPEGENPLENDSLQNYEVIKMDVTKMTREALKEITMGMKEKDRAKNMFVLGFLYWMYNRDMNNTCARSFRPTRPSRPVRARGAASGRPVLTDGRAPGRRASN